MRRASAVPPVMHEIKIGAFSVRPKRSDDRSTSESAISGAAHGSKRYRWKPASTPFPRTSRSILMRKWSAFREDVVAGGARSMSG
jgi:hypothetical protein